MESKLIKVLPSCFCPSFGLKIEHDPQYNRAFVLDVDAKSSAAKLCSSLKATKRAIRLSYIVEIAGHRIFIKSKATTALSQIRDAGVCEFQITFAIEPPLSAQQRKWIFSMLEPCLIIGTAMPMALQSMQSRSTKMILLPSVVNLILVTMLPLPTC